MQYLLLSLSGTCRLCPSAYLLPARGLVPAPSFWVLQKCAACCLQITKTLLYNFFGYSMLRSWLLAGYQRCMHDVTEV